MHWGDLVSAKLAAHGQLVLGIDPAPEHAPLALTAGAGPFLRQYAEVLLGAAHGLVGFVKFQSAFFEAFGSEGVAELARAIAAARELDYAVILDAKRGDIGSTAEAYAQAYLSPAHAGGSDLEADCLTVNPFLGPETLEPFVARARDFGKGLFVLVRTSNPDSGWLQDQRLNGNSVSELLAELVAGWAEATVGTNGVGAVGAVVGATYPDQASRLRKLMPRSTFLAPGLGSQGGDAGALSSLATKTGPVLLSASRGIARVDDRDMSIETYKELVRDRIVAYAAAAKRQGGHGR
jgi:orotidine-5'-phosphate decarboxylase